MKPIVKVLFVIILFNVMACVDNRQQNTEAIDLTNVSLLTQKMPQSDYMEALLSSRPEKISVDENGCIRIKDYLIIWPFGFKLAKKDDIWVILNDVGTRIADFEGKVILSGGECAGCSDKQIKEITGARVNANCKGSYWIVGSEIRSK